jgi:hypothetical protein
MVRHALIVFFAFSTPLNYLKTGHTPHTRLSKIVSAALTDTSSSSPTFTSLHTQKLIKTLPTTLGMHDPSCAAQGPIWALCTVAALIVLLGPVLVHLSYIRTSRMEGEGIAFVDSWQSMFFKSLMTCCS